MKQIFTTFLLTSALAASAQVYLPMKDFTDQSLTSGGWTTQVVLSSPGAYDWNVSNQGTGSNYYVRASGWNGTAADNTELWYISPAMDLSTATAPALHFRNAKNFNGPALAMVVSTNYDGTSLPSTATWTTITTQATWSTGMFTFVNSGNIDLTPYNGQSAVYVAWRYTSSTAGGAATWELDDIFAQEGGLAPAPFVSIYDIQFTSLPLGDSPQNGNVVKTGGVVTAVHTNLTTGDVVGFFIQDGSGPWSGLYVYDPTPPGTMPVLGDSVVVEGEVTEFNSMTEMINLASITVLSSGNTKTPNVISTQQASQEEWESVLVRFNAATVTANNQPVFQFTVNDGSGGVFADDLLFVYAMPAVGNILNLTGPMFYSFNERKILPRSAGDIQNITSVNELTIEQSIYPNPSNGMFTVNSSISNGTIIVRDALGRQIHQQAVNSNTSFVNLETQSNGIYFMELRNGELSKTVRVVVAR